MLYTQQGEAISAVLFLVCCAPRTGVLTIACRLLRQRTSRKHGSDFSTIYGQIRLPIAASVILELLCSKKVGNLYGKFVCV
ncbi:hypothetical protein ANAPRD1_00864 [Anaplasma phagocytophilum]|nr:hypothetical protein ANAPRD1_00864 [Anaplasma phagocytophilum]